MSATNFFMKTSHTQLVKNGRYRFFFYKYQHCFSTVRLIFFSRSLDTFDRSHVKFEEILVTSEWVVPLKREKKNSKNDTAEFPLSIHTSKKGFLVEK